MDTGFFSSLNIADNLVMHGPVKLGDPEVDTLLGNPNKAKKYLKWKPKINIKQLVNEMVNEDLKLLLNNDKKKR